MRNFWFPITDIVPLLHLLVLLLLTITTISCAENDGKILTRKLCIVLVTFKHQKQQQQHKLIYYSIYLLKIVFR
jgi:hypothetical protein